MIRPSLLAWSAYFYVVALILAAARWRLLSRVESIQEPLADLPWVVSVDLAISGITGLFLFLALPRRWAWLLASLLYLTLLISIFFQIKMQLPLTFGLLSQVGGTPRTSNLDCGCWKFAPDGLLCRPCRGLSHRRRTFNAQVASLLVLSRIGTRDRVAVFRFYSTTANSRVL